jgi:cystathionine beta-lyase/cystathionine gamma-synthase
MTQYKSYKKDRFFDGITPFGDRPMLLPIVGSVNYEYYSFEILGKVRAKEIQGYTYDRDDNPTVLQLEKQVKRLEAGAHSCMLTTSGCAALTMIYLTFLKAGDELMIFNEIYGGNYKIALILEKFGVKVTWLDIDHPEQVAQKISKQTKMIACESPTNPLTKVVDLRYLKQQADKVGAMLMVDNTYATGIHQEPFNLGADIVMHSATKAMGGHNDLMAGAIFCKDAKQYEDLWYCRQAIGTLLDPFSASFLERGLKTYNLRIPKMAENAMAVSEFLEGHKRIEKVYYPGLKSFAGHEIASRQMSHGFGAMMAFEIEGDIANTYKFIEKLKYIHHAISLGCTETLVGMPYFSTMTYWPEADRIRFGVKPKVVRLSAGIEEKEDLIADLKQALEK